MRKVYTSLLFALGWLFVHTGAAQSWEHLLDWEEISWKAREAEVDPVLRQRVVDSLRTLFPQTEAIDYHFLDFSGDGRLDVVFNGYNGPVESETILFFVRSRKIYELVFEGAGYPTRLTRQAPWLPMHFTLATPGCCADPRHLRTDYSPYKHGITLGYDAQSIVIHMVDRIRPEAFFETPRPFVVQQEQYNLRSAPEIDNTPDEGPWGEIRGNILATYSQGTTGLAVAERTDRTGRVWYLVLIPLAERPLWEPRDIYQLSIDRSRASLLGWMSSRFLAELK